MKRRRSASLSFVSQKSAHFPLCCDIRGAVCLSSFHFIPYWSFLRKRDPQLFLPAPNGMSIEKSSRFHLPTLVLKDWHFDEKSREACYHVDVLGLKCEEITARAYPLHVSGNHWTLVYIDQKKRTVEYYDSLKEYGNQKEIAESLTRLAATLTERDPGDNPYQFVCKINKKLQRDGYQCGVWMLYFLENRWKDPDVDFNQLDVDEAQKMIASYRLQVMDKLIEISADCHTTDKKCENCARFLSKRSRY